MGRVLEHSSRKQAEASSRPADARELGTQDSSLALTAKRLLSFACRVGWSAVSELLLPIASDMTASASELVAELETLADEGLTLLHHAVRSRNVALVSAVQSCLYQSAGCQGFLRCTAALLQGLPLLCM